MTKNEYFLSIIFCLFPFVLCTIISSLKGEDYRKIKSAIENDSESLFLPATDTVVEMFGVSVIRRTSRIKGDVTVAYTID
jgi:hypothetical protein